MAALLRQCSGPPAGCAGFGACEEPACCCECCRGGWLGRARLACQRGVARACLFRVPGGGRCVCLGQKGALGSLAGPCKLPGDAVFQGFPAAREAQARSPAARAPDLSGERRRRWACGTSTSGRTTTSAPSSTWTSSGRWSGTRCAARWQTLQPAQPAYLWGVPGSGRTRLTSALLLCLPRDAHAAPLAGCAPASAALRASPAVPYVLPLSVSAHRERSGPGRPLLAAAELAARPQPAPCPRR